MLWVTFLSSPLYACTCGDIIPILSPSDYVFTANVLVLYLPQHGVRDLSRTPVISASSKTLTFYNKDTRGEIQKASFNEAGVKRIFHGSFHKVDTTHNSLNKEHCVRNIITLL